MTQKIYNIASVIVVILLILFLLKTCEAKKATEDLNEQSKDSLTVFRDKDGLQHAQISVLNGSVSDLKKLNSTKDSTLKKLQDLVDKNTVSATILNTKTTDKGSTKTTVTFNTPSREHVIAFNPHNEKIDTLHIGHDVITPCDTVYPTYSTTWKDKWSFGTIIANKDTINRDIKFFNEFDIKQELKREHWWKEKSLVVEVVSKNPNTVTTDLKTFTVANKKVRRIFIFVSGVIIGGVATFFIIKS